MSNKSTILFSGIQPTGEIHIGNYLGALKNWVALQTDYQALYCVVDLHALTIEQNPQEFADQIRRTAIDLLALGINPDTATLFVQSHVREHSELAWLLNTLTPIAELERMTQFKDKAQKNKANINMGLFDYPVLMAADILLYHGEAVPVGEDQVQHIELTNMLARKFNNKYGQTFQPVKPLLTAGARIMSLTEPDKKMSKSLGTKNYIALRDDADTIRKKVSRAITAGDNTADEMPIGVRNLFTLLREFDQDACTKFESDYHEGTIQYSLLKETLAEAIISHLKPVQSKIKDLEDDIAMVDKVLKKGAAQASSIAATNMKVIRQKMGLL
ncbi:MAG: tryptophan--tRNA ligase [Candidatus Komeilibacteria bacterium]|nr:tryptophan--tRNA ligase [Candidatus Komeilibacteria bacterium]